MSAGDNFAELYLTLRPAELDALKRHLIAIRDPDRDKRYRAKKEYRRFLDYLTSINRITPAMRNRLEHYKLEARHTEGG